MSSSYSIHAEPTVIYTCMYLSDMHRTLQGLAWACLTACLMSCLTVGAQVFKIGYLYTDTPEGISVGRFLNLTFQHLLAGANDLQGVDIELVSAATPGQIDVLAHIQKGFQLAELGCIAVIGPQTSTDTKGAQIPLAALNLPQVAPVATDPELTQSYTNYPYLLKMSASDSDQVYALASIVRQHGWTKFSILYEYTDYGRGGADALATLATEYRWSVMKRESFDGHVPPEELHVTGQLLRIHDTGVSIVVLFGRDEQAWAILDQANALDMMEPGWVWLTTDGVTMAAAPGYSTSGDTSLVTVPRDYQGLVGTAASLTEGGLYDQAVELLGSLNTRIVDSVSQAFLLRYFDAAVVVVRGLQLVLATNNISQPHFEPGLCQDVSVEPWVDGWDLFRSMQSVQSPGAMNVLNFTTANSPWYVSYDIVNLRSHGWEKVGVWQVGEDGPELSLTERILFPGGTWTAPSEVATIDNLTLTVVTILEEPFAMAKHGTVVRGSLPYSGYAIDLLEELQRKLNFDFNIYAVADSEVGTLNPVTQEWDGMMREILHENADIAIGPILITELRSRYVDFTPAFLDLSYNVLIPVDTPPLNIFAFLDPFESNLWLGVVLATIVFGVAIAACSYFSPFGWQGRYTQRRDPAVQKHFEKRHYLSLHHALWFSVASLMKQGPERMPFSLSGRLVAGVWWGAAMIFGASYTANLAAFLTVARLDTGIATLQDLAEQRNMLYGTVRGSVVDQYFSQQTVEPYPQMYSIMETFSTWVPNHHAGIEKVRNSSTLTGHGPAAHFAFIYDSVTLQYAASNPPCVTRTLAGSFGQVGFGLALPKNSPVKEGFDVNIRELRENGFLDYLNNKWLGGSCSTTSDTEETRFSLTQMSGIFLLLIAGIVLSLFIVLLEYLVAALRDVIADREEGVCQRQ